jgi:hypothetical protein
MDLRGLGAFLSAIAGYFSAQAGAKAGQLQGLLMGEDITERRKRMRMAEETHELQKRIAEAEEQRRAELFPLTKRGMEQQIQQAEELFPLKKEALTTQVETGKLNLLNQRLWSLYQRGVVPSQITDPVLRAEYEPFFNYMNSVHSLEAVQSGEELETVLGKVPEEWRGTLEIIGRIRLFRNQMQKELIERQLKSADLNIAQGEYQLRSAQLNNALNIILGNIDREGINWDKRTPEQKIQAVQKWLKDTGLDAYVPEGFANMFQRIQSSDARQYALLQLQTDLQLRANMSLLRQQIAGNLALLQNQIYGNLLFGALTGQQQGNFGGMPFGFPAPPTMNIFKGAYDNRQTNINESGLRDYLKIPMDIPVPVRVGNQPASRPLSVLATEAGNIYRRLGRPDATLTAEDINTLVAYDAGLIMAGALQNNSQIDWNTAFTMAKDRVVATLKANPAYRTQITHYQRVLDNWVQALERNLQAGGTAPQRTPAPQQGQRGGAQPANPAPQGGQTAPPAQSRGGSPNYTSSARRRRQ